MYKSSIFKARQNNNHLNGTQKKKVKMSIFIARQTFKINKTVQEFSIQNIYFFFHDHPTCAVSQNEKHRQKRENRQSKTLQQRNQNVQAINRATTAAAATDVATERRQPSKVARSILSVFVAEKKHKKKRENNR